ncbi:MAG: hypothetical protein A2731_01130 [Candidatus Buchananbacteria bacterium RIFCSPHIGHO2_01_FULL_39_8]|uniref:HTH arsR-type domain-containing protein n=1 Tax=Candidatus Buchananbacteria bacterium RIFCSPHIGHO2_01_FULL_39_8 TaxID=1797533 RepID=A0A1G1Y1E5_9BACT|nr:MAG: hypothetical protein A2731_01130 [Candidatus Buchananbacteria bacterium RIFCSPHIGHO2_01_FULL_39_8]
MLLEESEIKKIRQKMIGISEDINNKCNLYSIGSDPTRLKILTLLGKKDELCVSDIAMILKISISAISHQLRLLERCGLVKSEKTGKIVCYSLASKNLKFDLLNIKR